ncbi:MAG: hypothetical protein ACOC1V_00570 [Candidatus Saliniplasma sp.]
MKLKSIQRLEDLQNTMFPLKEVPKLDKRILLTLKRFDGAESIKFLLKKIEDSRKPVERSTLQYRIKNLPDLELIEIERYDRKLRLDLTRLGKIFLEGL